MSDVRATGYPSTPSRAKPARLLTLRAFVSFVLIDVGFRLFGFERIFPFLSRSRSTRPARPAEEARARAIETFGAVQRATRLYYRRRKDCLPKALTTFSLLRRQGLEAELCFGVRRFPFAAHSWVDAYGAVLDDDPPRTRTYTVIHRVTT